MLNLNKILGNMPSNEKKILLSLFLLLFSIRNLSHLNILILKIYIKLFILTISTFYEIKFLLLFKFVIS
jgi:hypothetical protein